MYFMGLFLTDWNKITASSYLFSSILLLIESWPEKESWTPNSVSSSNLIPYIESGVTTSLWTDTTSVYFWLILNLESSSYKSKYSFFWSCFKSGLISGSLWGRGRRAELKGAFVCKKKVFYLKMRLILSNSCLCINNIVDMKSLRIFLGIFGELIIVERG